MVVKYANGKFSIPVEKGDQYPTMSTDNTATPLLVSGNDLLYGIRQVLFCSANDELRPVLNGVYFDIDLDTISFVATDGTRLAMIENPSLIRARNGQPSSCQVNLPKSFLILFRKIAWK